MTNKPTVIALAGRRFDAPGANPPRFPKSSAERMQAEITRVLRDQRAVALVASGACGADLIALKAAADLGVRTRIVLPFSEARFRTSSVIDRDEESGPAFDAALALAKGRGDVVVLDVAGGTDDDAYAVATRRIISEATTLGKQYGAEVRALAVWDNMPRAEGDATQDFIEQAAIAGIAQLPAVVTRP